MLHACSICRSTPLFTLYFARALSVRACVRAQFSVWRGSIISPTEEGLSPKRLVNQLLFDTFKSLLSLIFSLQNRRISGAEREAHYTGAERESKRNPPDFFVTARVAFVFALRAHVSRFALCPANPVLRAKHVTAMQHESRITAATS